MARPAKLLEYEGRRQTAFEWAVEWGLSRQRIAQLADKQGKLRKPNGTSVTTDRRCGRCGVLGHYRTTCTAPELSRTAGE